MQIEPLLSDKALLAEARDGVDSAFRQLFDKYWEDLFQLAYKRLRSKDDASHIVQEVFVSLWNNIHQVETEESIGGYLFVSLRNKIFNHYEKQSIRLKHLLAQPFNPVESEEMILASIQQKEILRIVSAEVKHMPAKMREIYQLSREQQLTIGEIAELLLIAPQTVKNQLHRALERIRQSLRNNNFGSFCLLF